MDMDDHVLIKQVDLGGLSAALFTPSAQQRAQHLASQQAGHGLGEGVSGSMSSSPDAIAISSRRPVAVREVGRPVAASPHAPPSPSPAAYAFSHSLLHMGVQGNGSSGVGMPGSPSAAGRAAGMDPMPPAGVSRGPGADGRPASGHVRWGSSRPEGGSSHLMPLASGGATGGGGGVGAAASSSSRCMPSADALEAAAAAARLQLMQASQHLTRPPTRQVQSARPVGQGQHIGQELELDASVWEATIAIQLQRPPSRQKPPPEALHLWTTEQQLGLGPGRGPGSGRAGGHGGKGGGGGRPMRPASAMPTAYRAARPQSGPRVQGMPTTPGGE